MTNGTSQGLFIVVAIVIFGIFIVLSNTLFGDQLSNGLESIFTDSIGRVSVLREDDTDFPEHLDEHKEYNDYFYVVDTVKERVMITGYSGEDADIVIPNEIEGYPVTHIANGTDAVGGMGAFYDMGLTSVVLPETLISITNSGVSNQRGAFRGNLLTNVTVPEGVFNLGHGAFANNELESITLPSTLKYIGRGAVGYNQLSELTLPENLEYIGNSAFRTNNLTSIIIPDSVTDMPSGTFQYNKLSSVTIGSGLSTIGINTFLGNELDDIHIPNTILYIGRHAFGENNLTNVYIPNSVERIRHSAFRENPLESISIPSYTVYDTTEDYHSFGGFEPTVRP